MKIFDSVEISKLHNGLTIITDHQPQSEPLYAQIVVFAGGLHDPTDKLGVAHFLEHMWTHSHPSLTNKDFFDLGHNLGVARFSSLVTSKEYTKAYVSGTSEAVRSWLDVVGDMIGQDGL